MDNYTTQNHNDGQKPVAVVLGGTVPHADMIALLKKEGYYTVLVDYFQNPPAAKEADRHYRESAMDFDAVLSIAKSCHASLVMSPCLDQQMNIAMRVSEELNLPHPFSPGLVSQVTDKTYMKRAMVAGNIPTAPYYDVESGFDLSNIKLDFPVMVKPSDSCGSAGVTKVACEEELPAAVNKAILFSASKKGIIEEFLEGTEMSVHCFVYGGRANILYGTCRVVQNVRGCHQLLCSIYIPQTNPGLQNELEATANSIVKVFSLPDLTPFFMQVMVKDGAVRVIEFSPRIAGGISSYIAREFAGFDYFQFSLDSYLKTNHFNGQADFKLRKYISSYSIYCTEGIFDSIRGVDELQRKNIVKKMFVLHEPGDEIKTDKPSSCNVLKYVIEGNTPRECYEKIILADEYTEILDINGKSMRDRSSVLTEEMLNEKLLGLE